MWVLIESYTFLKLRIEPLPCRHDFAGCKNSNLEFVVGGFGNRLGQDLSTAA